MLGLKLSSAAHNLEFIFSISPSTFSMTAPPIFFFFFFNDTATTEIYTLSLHDALPISAATGIYEAFDKKLPRHPLVLEGLREAKAGKKLSPLIDSAQAGAAEALYGIGATRSEEHTSELQSHSDLVCRLLLEKKKKKAHRSPLPRPAQTRSAHHPAPWQHDRLDQSHPARERDAADRHRQSGRTTPHAGHLQDY